jgi:Tfp pilus assembly protein PilN
MNRINLLPPAERVKASREQGIAYALLVLVAVIVVLGVVYVLEYNKIAAKQSTLDATTAQVDQLNAEIASLQPYEALQGTASAMNDMAAQVADARIDWASILGELSLVVPDNVQFSSFSATVPGTMQAGGALAGAGQASAAATTATPDITITGIAGDSHVTVAELMVRLGLIPQFMNIELQSSTEVAGVAPPTPTPTSEPTSAPTSTPTPTLANDYQFSITANLRPFLVAPPFSVAGGVTGAAAGGTGQ